MTNSTPDQHDDPLVSAIETFARAHDISESYASRLVAGRSTYIDDLRAGNRGNSDKRIAVYRAIEDITEQRQGKALAKAG